MARVRGATPTPGRPAGRGRDELRRSVDGRRARMLAAARRAVAAGTASEVAADELRALGVTWFATQQDRAAPTELLGASHWPALPGAYEHLDRMDALTRGTTSVRVVFDHAEVQGHVGGAALPFLAACSVDYRLGYVPVDAWVVDARSATIGAPRTDDASPTVIRSEEAAVVAAVRRYLDAVAATATPASELVRPAPLLTRRQHAIAATLLEVGSDDEAASVLGIGVRTLRGEIRVLCGVFGVTNRVALGLAYGRLTAPSADVGAADRAVSPPDSLARIRRHSSRAEPHMLRPRGTAATANP